MKLYSVVNVVTIRTKYNYFMPIFLKICIDFVYINLFRIIVELIGNFRSGCCRQLSTHYVGRVMSSIH